MYSGKNRVLALLSHVLLFKMFVPSFEGSFGVQMWFISTIIQFYLIFLPVCHLKERMENNQFIILSILLSLIWATIITTLNKVDNRVWNSFFVQYFWEFSIGMCLGEYFKNKQHEYFTRFHYLTLIIVFGISFCIYAIMALKYVEWRAFNDAFGVTAFGSLMLILYKLGFLKKLFIWINSFSYELFLVHILLFTIMFKYLVPILPHLLVGFLSLIVTLLVALGMKKIRL